MYMKNITLYFSLFMMISMAENSFSQVIIDTTEITASVPELTGFHEIIYPMWHTAYPAKDITSLKGFIPRIKSSMTAINSAILPGILKEKEVEWKNQLKELNVAAENYYAAAEKNDNEALLSAAEKLHAGYEMMNRVIRPAMTEIYEYHQILYVIIHKLWPEKNYDAMAALMDGLVAKADAIVKVPRENLNRRLGDKISDFDVASGELYSATVALKDVLKGNDMKMKDETIQHMHEVYENLDSLFK
jgi:hypothetical protein